MQVGILSKVVVDPASLQEHSSRLRPSQLNLLHRNLNIAESANMGSFLW